MQALLLTLMLLAPQAGTDTIVRVYVEPLKAAEFVDNSRKHLDQAHKSLITELRRKTKTLTLVDSRETADVVLELLSVDYANTGDTETKANFLGPGVTTKDQKAFHATARLQVSGTDYATDLKVRSPFYAIAGGLIGVEADKWIKANRQQVLAKRQ